MILVMTLQTSLHPFLEKLNHLIYQVWRIPYPEAEMLPDRVLTSPPAPLSVTPLVAEPALLTESPDWVSDPASEVLPAEAALSPTWAGRRQHIYWHSSKMSYRFGRVRIKTLHA